MTCLFLAEKWCRIRDSISTLNCQLASLAAQNRQKNTCCVVLKATEDENKDAADCGVKLILPCSSEEALANDKPNFKWLLSPDTYFPALVKLQNVEYIVEHVHGSTKFSYANSLRKRYFYDANIVIVNHTAPPDSNEHKMIQLRLAELATTVFSIGPTIFEQYEKLYGRNDINVKHELYLPRPDMAFFDLNADRSHKMSDFKQILSIITDMDVECEKYQIVSAAVGQSAETFYHMCAKIPKWVVRSMPETDPDYTRVFLKHNLKCSYLEPTTFPPYRSQDERYTDFLESDVLIIPPDEQFSIEALQAIAAGLPVLVPRRTATAEFLKRYFHDIAEYFLYHPAVDDLSKHINKALNSTQAISIAFQLKNKYLSHQTVIETNVNFRSCFLGTITQQTSKVYSSLPVVPMSEQKVIDDVFDLGSQRISAGQSSRSRVEKNVQRRKVPFMPTIKCDSHLEVQERKSEREIHNIEIKIAEAKLWAIKQAYELEVQRITARPNEGMAEELDKAYEKFNARLDKCVDSQRANPQRFRKESRETMYTAPTGTKHQDYEGNDKWIIEGPTAFSPAKTLAAEPEPVVEAEKPSSEVPTAEKESEEPHTAAVEQPMDEKHAATTIAEQQPSDAKAEKRAVEQQPVEETPAAIQEEHNRESQAQLAGDKTEEEQQPANEGPLKEPDAVAAEAPKANDTVAIAEKEPEPVGTEGFTAKEPGAVTEEVTAAETAAEDVPASAEQPACRAADERTYDAETEEPSFTIEAHNLLKKERNEKAIWKEQSNEQIGRPEITIHQPIQATYQLEKKQETESTLSKQENVAEDTSVHQKQKAIIRKLLEAMEKDYRITTLYGKEQRTIKLFAVDDERRFYQLPSGFTLEVPPFAVEEDSELVVSCGNGNRPPLQDFECYQSDVLDFKTNGAKFKRPVYLLKKHLNTDPFTRIQSILMSKHDTDWKEVKKVESPEIAHQYAKYMRVEIEHFCVATEISKPYIDTFSVGKEGGVFISKKDRRIFLEIPEDAVHDTQEVILEVHHCDELKSLFTPPGNSSEISFAPIVYINRGKEGPTIFRESITLNMPLPPCKPGNSKTESTLCILKDASGSCQWQDITKNCSGNEQAENKLKLKIECLSGYCIGWYRIPRMTSRAVCEMLSTITKFIRSGRQIVKFALLQNVDHQRKLLCKIIEKEKRSISEAEKRCSYKESSVSSGTFITPGEEIKFSVYGECKQITYLNKRRYYPFTDNHWEVSVKKLSEYQGAEAHGSVVFSTDAEDLCELTFMLSKEGETKEMINTNISRTVIPLTSIHPFKMLLLELQGLMSPDDVRHLKFVARDDQISTYYLEKMNCPLDIFDHLLKKGIIKKDNLKFLENAFQAIHNYRLVEKVKNYSKRETSISVVPTEARNVRNSGTESHWSLCDVF